MADRIAPPNLPVGPGTPPPHEEPKPEEPVTEEPKDSRTNNILAIMGLVIVAIIVVWGLVHLVSLFIGSGSPQPAASIQVSAPGSAKSGESFTLSWKFAPKTEGAYAFLYPCSPKNVSFSAVVHGEKLAIPCGAAFTMPPTIVSLTLTPKLSNASSTVTTLSIVYLPTATSTPATAGTAEGATTITINPAGSSASTATATKTASKPVTAKARTCYSPADLAVSGVSGSVDASGNAVVTFTVANVGCSTSGTYQFVASLPTAAGSYNSSMQSALGPGDRIVNTLRFGPVNQGGGVFTVTVIPNGADSSAADNTGSFTLNFYGGYNYQNGYPTPYTSYGGSVYSTYPYGPQYQYYPTY